MHATAAAKVVNATLADPAIDALLGALTDRRRELEAAADALSAISVKYRQRVVLPLGSHLLVPATITHTNEVLVNFDTEDGLSAWMTAEGARRVLASRAALVDRQVERMTGSPVQQQQQQPSKAGEAEGATATAPQQQIKHAQQQLQSTSSGGVAAAPLSPATAASTRNQQLEQHGARALPASDTSASRETTAAARLTSAAVAPLQHEREMKDLYDRLQALPSDPHAPSVYEADVDGEKLVYITEWEEDERCAAPLPPTDARPTKKLTKAVSFSGQDQIHEFASGAAVAVADTDAGDSQASGSRTRVEHALGHQHAAVSTSAGAARREATAADALSSSRPHPAAATGSKAAFSGVVMERRTPPAVAPAAPPRVSRDAVGSSGASIMPPLGASSASSNVAANVNAASRAVGANVNVPAEGQPQQRVSLFRKQRNAP